MFIRCRTGDVDPIFPLELCPHTAELQVAIISWGYRRNEVPHLCLRAMGGFDIIHDVDVDVVEDHALLRHVLALPKYAAKDNAGLGGGNLDRGLDALKTMRCNCVHRRSLDKFEISQCREVQTKILQRVSCLIDQQDVCLITTVGDRFDRQKHDAHRAKYQIHEP